MAIRRKTIFEIRDEAPKIYELIMKRRKDSNVTLPITKGSNIVNYSFVWIYTPEGYNFWEDISYGEYDVFYSKYPQHRSIDNFSII